MILYGLIGWFVVGFVSNCLGILVDRFLAVNKIKILDNRCLQIKNLIFGVVMGGVTLWILIKAIWLSIRDRWLQR